MPHFVWKWFYMGKCVNSLVIFNGTFHATFKEMMFAGNNNHENDNSAYAYFIRRVKYILRILGRLFGNKIEDE